MAKEYAKGFYNSPAWKACRAAYTKHARGLCERCRERGRIRSGVIVHHVTPIAPDNINDPSITLSFDNLMLVCRDCHAELHEGRERRYKLDEMGRVTVI